MSRNLGFFGIAGCVAAACFLSGCGRDRSGRYESLMRSDRVCYVLASGRCVDLNTMEGMLHSPFMTAASDGKPARKSRRMVETKLILTLKQDGPSVGGNLVVTDDQTLRELVV